MRRLLLAMIIGWGVLGTGLGETNNEPAEIQVSGHGFFGNRELKNVVQMLRPSRSADPVDASFVEDAIVVLFSRLARDGYLAPRIVTRVVLENGRTLENHWTEPLEQALPRGLRIEKAEFEIHRGKLFYYEKLEFKGLETITEKQARGFFIQTGTLIPLKRNRIYSPNRLRSGLNNLEETLHRQGYENARISATNLVIITNRGAVQVELMVEQGPKSLIRQVRTEIYPADQTRVPITNVVVTNVPFSQLWLQDFVQRIRRQQFARGHADTEIRTEQERRIREENQILIDLVARVTPGEQVRIGEVRFEGEKETHESLMRRKVRLYPNQLFDPIKAEQGRYRLARLGAFESVELTYEQGEEQGTRDIVYKVREGKELEFSLLAGYGSYEQLRGGFSLEQYNLWGQAHRSHLRAVQSFKSSTANYLYTIPQVAGDDTDFFLHASGLRREELEFTREEFGGGAGARRFIPVLDSDLGVRYSYQVLNAANLDISNEDGRKKANVGSVAFDLKHDRRDNPLVPRTGYKVSSTLEVADEMLAGNAEYQRFETTVSWHRPLGEGRWFHLGVSHGLITSDGDPAENLPFNRRFFPGGENSIRGYQYGEASPRNAAGRIVGAESYLLGNVEFEQALTRALSLVFFVDGLGAARRLDNYPFDETLYSAGGGLRWKTIIGPARLEYGYNLNRRAGDPMGTLHFSIGFPF